MGTPTLSTSFTGREGRSHRARAACGFLGDTMADGVPERGESGPGEGADLGAEREGRRWVWSYQLGCGFREPAGQGALRAWTRAA